MMPLEKAKGAVTLVFEAEIPGRVHAKKNSRRLALIQGKPRSFASKHYKQWERSALITLKQARLRRDSIQITKDIPLHASYRFHFKNRQAEADVSNMIEGPQDCLQESGVIENDKQIVSLDAQKIFDGTEKTIIRLFTLT